MKATCDWKQVAVDEWEMSCVPSPDTVPLSSNAHWKHCPYCGKKINWLTKPQVVVS